MTAVANTERAFLEWMYQPAEDRGLYIAGNKDTWEFCSYRELARKSSQIP